MTAVAVVPTTEAREQFVVESQERSVALVAQVNRIAKAKVDAVADTRTLVIEPTPVEMGDLPIFERVRAKAPGGLTVALSAIAHDQLATRLSIPKPYYQRMLMSQPDLLAANMNRWMQSEPDVRLLRMLKPVTEEDGQMLHRTGATLKLRAIVGKTYRMIDDAELVAAVIEPLRERGAYLRAFDLTDQRLHARFVTFAEEIASIRARHGLLPGVGAHQIVNGRDISWVNEVVAMGVSLRHSETGFASLDVSGFLEILKCLNGYIATTAVRQRHVGRRHAVEGTDDLAYLSETTQVLDNAALMSRVQDAVIDALDGQRQLQMVGALQAAKVDTVDLGERPLFQFLGTVGGNLDLNDSEIDLLREETALAVNEEGGRTRFAFAQGITAVARQMADFDRRTQLERTGWQVVSGDASAVLDLGREVARRNRQN